MGLLASSQLLTSLLVVGLALTTAALLMRTARRLSRRTSTAEPIVDSRRVVEPGHPKATCPPPELVQWEVQMHETARELTSVLASRISVLRALVAEADRAAARLETALDAAAQLAAQPGIPGQGRSHATDPCTSRGDRAPQSAPRCEGRSQAGGLGAPAFAGGNDPAAGEAQGQLPQPVQEPPGQRLSAEQLPPCNAASLAAPRCSPQRREEICLLADYGFGPTEIARRTSTPVGEVELILGLRRGVG